MLVRIAMGFHFC